MRKNSWIYGIISFAIFFVASAVIFKIFNIEILPAQFYGALIGVVITAIITVFLLKGQSAGEELKEKNTKIFEEKLRIYQEFLQKLCEVVKDKKISENEAIELQFQTSYIAMHTSSKSIKVISEKVLNIVKRIQSPVDEDKRSLLLDLFDIVTQFQIELYSNKEQVSQEEIENRITAVDNFRSIDVPQNELTIYERLLMIKEMVRSKIMSERTLVLEPDFKQWIWNNKSLVHDLKLDNSLVLSSDAYIKNENWIITLFIRGDQVDQQVELLKSEFFGKDSMTEYNNGQKEGVRYIYKKIDTSRSNIDIAECLIDLVVKMNNYKSKYNIS